MTSSDRKDRLKDLSPAKRALLLRAARKEAVATADTPRIPRRDPSQPAPLSFAQQRLWFLDQLAPGNAAYHLGFALRLTGPLDRAALAASLSAVIARHESLRTVFVAYNGQTFQQIVPPHALALPLFDLRELPEPTRDDQLQQLAQTVGLAPFDLATGPLLRAALVWLAADSHTLLLTLHHIVADGWSLGVLTREVLTHYRSQRLGQVAELPELPVQYADYAVWQRSWLQGAVLERQLAHWRDQLADAPALLELPTDRPRPATPSFRGASVAVELPVATLARLRALCEHSDATLFMVLLAGWAMLLARYSGQADVVVGSPIANRERLATEGLIGFFVNTLALRVRLAGNPTFRDLLARVREVCLSAYAHQELPFEQLVEALQPVRVLRHTPVFQVMFVFQNAPQAPLALPELAVEGAGIATGMTKFDMTLTLSEGDDTIVGQIEYQTELFDATTITRMAGHFQILLAGVAAAPTLRVADLPLLTAAEREQVLHEWNDTIWGVRGQGSGVRSPTSASRQLISDIRCIHELFEAQVARAPDAIALVFDDGALSYAALHARANQLTIYLQQRGIGPEVLVALCCDRSLDLLVGLFGILQAGGAYLPLDPSYPPERLAFMITDARPQVLLTQRSHSDGRLGEVIAMFPSHVVYIDADWPQIATAPVLAQPVVVQPENLAYVIYTSGSTGTPKGVGVTHAGLVNYVACICQKLGLNDAARANGLQFATVSTIAADLGNTAIFPALASGGCLHVLSYDVATDSALFGSYLAQHAIDVLKIVPSHLSALLASAEPAKILPRRFLILGGEALSPKLLKRIATLSSTCAVINHYGPTEATIGALTFRLSENDTNGMGMAVTVPIGQPIANTLAYILDRQMQPVPIGVTGELYIGGVGLARGYLNRPELTAERFIPNPFADAEDKETRSQGAKEPRSATEDRRQSAICNLQSAIGMRLYKTGDMARFQIDGTIEFLGRIDGQVKLRGFRIELGEIETALRGCVGVTAAAVVLRADAPGDAQLVAYVVPTTDDRPPTIDDGAPTIPSSIVHRPSSIVTELRSFLSDRLPNYMLPSAFVLLDALPLTPNGKLDRQALPAPELSSGDAPLVAPQTPIEELLAQLWATLLRRAAVGRDDNFFALGGHSLLATQVVARIRTTFGVALPLRALFEAPTLASFAAEIARARQTALPSAPLLQHQTRPHNLPLSFAQERLWFLEQLLPGSARYHIPIALRLHGELDLRALTQTLTTLCARHETLRTSFAEHDGQPVQVIHPAPGRVADLLDLSGLPEAMQAETLPMLAALVTRQPFDLTHGPLLRVVVVRLDDDDHLLLVTMHHIVTDGWSVGIFVREVAQLYGGYLAGTPVALPELPIQYADYAIWQRTWLQGEGDHAGSPLQAQLAYWQAQLAGAPPLLDLPIDHRRSSASNYPGALAEVLIAPEVAAGLRALSRQGDATLFMTLLTSWAMLLHRYSSQADIVIGSPIAGRQQQDLEGLIGFFVNTLVLRVGLGSNPTSLELVGQVREICLEAYAHQELPFERLVEALQPTRELSHTPLFQVMFVLQNAQEQTLILPGLTIAPVGISTRTAKFDLTMTLSEIADGLRGSIEYNVDLFEAATIARMVRHFTMLLAGIVAAPHTRIADLPLLSAAEREQVLHEWNATAAYYPQDATVAALFATQAARTPDAIALVASDGALSYAALDARANQLAHYLRGAGVGPELRVALCIDRSPDLVVGALGILKAGGAYVPLDPTAPRERLAYMLADCRAPVLLSLARLHGAIPEHSGTTLCLDHAAADLALLPVTEPPLVTQLDNLAYVIYTSGSTGQPKGVEVSHRGLLNLVHWHQQTYAPTAADRTMLIAGVGFDGSVWELWPHLTAGASIHIPDDTTRGSPAELHDWLIARKLTLCFVPTPLAEALLTLDWPQEAPLRAMLTGGDRLRQPAPAAIGFTLVNHYGPTEATVLATCAPITTQLHEGELPPIGRPIANMQVYVLDPAMQPVPIGVAGELYIGGVQLARGYLNRPDLTAERFVPNPWGSGFRDQGSGVSDRAPDTPYPAPDTRLYKTGDVARFRTDGNLEFLGRLDHQVKLRGFRIELGEIEAVLTAQPSMRAAAVLLREDLLGMPQLVAYVVPAETLNAERRTINGPEWSSSAFSVQRSALGAELRSALAARLPEYMLPSAFVLLDALPLTPNGKIDRKALPAPELSSGDAPLVAPQTPIEELLAQLWATLLRRAAVGRDENFFALGGHSLLATQLVTRIRTTFAVELPLRTLFEAPTLAACAAEIARARQAALPSAPPLSKVEREGAAPLSFAQERLWFLEQLLPGSARYHIPIALRLHGELDLRALTQTLTILCARHETLRTSFAEHDGQPVQVIHPAPGRIADLLDLSGLPESAQTATLEPVVMAVAGQPFDLGRGPLLRVVVVQLNPAEQVLIVNMHHIISDGWSVGVFVREIEALYRGYLSGVPVVLPELPIQYADYVLWQRARLTGAVLNAELDYWRGQLAGAPALLDLPTDHPRPHVPSSAGAVATVQVAAAVAAELQALSRKTGATLFMVLLAGWTMLLHRYSGQTDVVVGSPIAGRQQHEVEGLIGLFVNTLVLRVGLGGNPTFTELVERVREVCLGAYAHQELPFERLVEALQPVRELRHTPLFQVMLTLQNTPQQLLTLPGLTIAPVGISTRTAKFDLTLALSETPYGLWSSIEYATALFEATTIARMMQHFTMLLTSIVANPHTRIDALPLLSAAEREQVLHEWNATDAGYPHDATIASLFATQAARTPDAIAVVASDGALSYAALEARANQLAHQLHHLGVGADTLVGLCLDRSLALLIGVLGILKAGGAYVPLDPTYPAERLAFMLADTAAPVVLTLEGLRERLLIGPGTHLLCLDHDWPTIAAQSTTSLALPLHSAQRAYVIYTSGSTGRPKGVMVLQRGLINLCYGLRTFFADPQVAAVGLITSISFDISVNQIFPTLLFGRTLHLLADEIKYAGSSLLAYVQRHGIGVLDGVPSYYQTVLSALDVPVATALRYLLIGGEKLERGLLRTIFARLGDRVAVVNIYGLTELTDINASSVIRAAAGEELVTVGRPLQNNRIYIVNGAGSLQPVGVTGELWIGGTSVARGYHNRPELTAERFVPNTWESGIRGQGSGVTDQVPDPRPPTPDPWTRLYKTGDLGRWRADGRIEVLGRADGQVKLRGFRIELGEIEAALLGRAEVAEAAVAVRTDISGEERLVAYIVPAETLNAERRTINGPEWSSSAFSVQRSALAAELRSFLSDRLPNYMLPSVFMLLPTLPKTPNGKIHRKALPSPDMDRTTPQASSVAPRDRLELRLAQLWEEILSLHPISVTDNFFDLGGHSLLAIRLAVQIERVFGQKLPLTIFFQGATIAQLADLLRRQETVTTVSPVVGIQTGGSRRPLFCVHPVSGSVLSYVELARQLGPDQPFYGLQAAGLEGEREAYGDVVEMAAEYIAAVRAVQPNGPYQLSGWSIGGVIAFEMTRQLVEQGQEVALLALFDSIAPHLMRQNGRTAFDAEALLIRFAQDFGSTLGIPVALPVEPLRALTPEQQLAYLFEQAQSIGIVSSDIGLDRFRQRFEVFKANIQAIERYTPQRTPLRPILFRGDESASQEFADAMLGWGEYVAGSVEVVHVPGDHYTMISQPHIQTLAAQLRKYLN